MAIPAMNIPQAKKAISEFVGKVWVTARPTASDLAAILLVVHRASFPNSRRRYEISRSQVAKILGLEDTVGKKEVSKSISTVLQNFWTSYEDGGQTAKKMREEVEKQLVAAMGEQRHPIGNRIDREQLHKLKPFLAPAPPARLLQMASRLVVLVPKREGKRGRDDFVRAVRRPEGAGVSTGPAAEAMEAASGFIAVADVLPE
mgnify:FL=1